MITLKNKPINEKKERQKKRREEGKEERKNNLSLQYRGKTETKFSMIRIKHRRI